MTYNADWCVKNYKCVYSCESGKNVFIFLKQLMLVDENKSFRQEKT